MSMTAFDIFSIWYTAYLNEKILRTNTGDGEVQADLYFKPRSKNVIKHIVMFNIITVVFLSLSLFIRTSRCIHHHILPLSRFTSIAIQAYHQGN